MKHKIYFILILSLFTACLSKKTKQEAKQEEYKTFTDDGAWCWFSDPRAVYLDGKTFAGWVTSAGDIVIAEYNHKTNNIQTKILQSDFQKNDHVSPSILFTPDKRLMVFYTKHAKKKPIQLHVSKNPTDISQWDTVRNLKLNDTKTYDGLDSYTYTNPCRLSGEDNKLFLFWRGMDFKPNVSTSNDGGNTWTTGKIFICPERIYKGRRPYLKVASNGKDKIHFAFTDGHPRKELNNSIYYACYYQNVMRKANGEIINQWDSLPISPKQSDLVYDASATGEKAWVWDIAYDKKNYPVIVFATFPNDKEHIYHYSRWDGEKWNTYKLINSGKWFPKTKDNKIEREVNYSGGVVLDHENPSILKSRENFYN